MPRCLQVARATTRRNPLQPRTHGSGGLLGEPAAHSRYLTSLRTRLLVVGPFLNGLVTGVSLRAELGEGMLPNHAAAVIQSGSVADVVDQLFGLPAAGHRKLQGAAHKSTDE